MAGVFSISSRLTPQEIQFEENILRNPYNIKTWLSYIEYVDSSDSTSLNLLYERSLKFLPRSYKLWHAYLQVRTEQLKKKPISDRSYQILINTYERALIHMNKMPRIWYIFAFISLF
jgi:pre-mRNA-splicing factor SYF1